MTSEVQCIVFDEPNRPDPEEEDGSGDTDPHGSGIPEGSGLEAWDPFGGGSEAGLGLGLGLGLGFEGGDGFDGAEEGPAADASSGGGEGGGGLEVTRIRIRMVIRIRIYGSVSDSPAWKDLLLLADGSAGQEGTAASSGRNPGGSAELSDLMSFENEPEVSSVSNHTLHTVRTRVRIRVRILGVTVHP